MRIAAVVGDATLLLTSEPPSQAGRKAAQS